MTPKRNSRGFAATALTVWCAAFSFSPEAHAQVGFAGIRIDENLGFPTMTVTGAVGSVCEIKYKDSLVPGLAWDILKSEELGAASIQIQDQSSPLPNSRFYSIYYVGMRPTNMVFVPPQTFTMGSPTNELGRAVDEGPQTTVTLTRGFFIGMHEVTQGEYASLVLTNPAFFQGDLGRPVERVSWADATNYCHLLTLRERQAGRLGEAWSYRLPTEAEWECACRAGTTTRFSYGDDPTYSSLPNYAWHANNSASATHPVGGRLSNPAGLFDMHGNVWAWCLDYYGLIYPGGSVVDPTGPGPSLTRIIRGGSWDNIPAWCRSATRGNENPINRYDRIGFRVVLAPPPGS